MSFIRSVHYRKICCTLLSMGTSPTLLRTPSIVVLFLLSHLTTPFLLPTSPAGKDLSRVSMPVSLNEPLSALQRLCEEVQYSELLDQAAGLDDPCDRMVRLPSTTPSYLALSHCLIYSLLTHSLTYLSHCLIHLLLTRSLTCHTALYIAVYLVECFSGLLPGRICFIFMLGSAQEK